jgi:hypothetical protein
MTRICGKVTLAYLSVGGLIHDTEELFVETGVLCFNVDIDGG